MCAHLTVEFFFLSFSLPNKHTPVMQTETCARNCLTDSKAFMLLGAPRFNHKSLSAV